MGQAVQLLPCTEPCVQAELWPARTEPGERMPRAPAISSTGTCTPSALTGTWLLHTCTGTWLWLAFTRPPLSPDGPLYVQPQPLPDAWYVAACACAAGWLVWAAACVQPESWLAAPGAVLSSPSAPDTRLTGTCTPSALTGTSLPQPWRGTWLWLAFTRPPVSPEGPLNVPAKAADALRPTVPAASTATARMRVFGNIF